MSKIFFTSDHHFNQRSFYKYNEKYGHTMRPEWSSPVEADEDIIKIHNSIVPEKGSIVYFLGDVAMNNTGLSKVAEMNGEQKVLIMGNHDAKFGGRKLLNYFDEVYGLYTLHLSGGYKLFLSHAPIKEKELSFRTSLNVHGHTHKAAYNADYYLNACIDYEPNKHAPIELDLEAMINKLESR